MVLITWEWGGVVVVVVVVKYLVTSQYTERTVQVDGLISFTGKVHNRTMAAVSDL
jgi:hypothetical protein